METPETLVSDQLSTAAVVANPDEFRLDRDLRNHVVFGMGIHYCLGAPLARAEAKITLNTFLDRFPTITAGTAPAVRQTGQPCRVWVSTPAASVGERRPLRCAW